MNTHNREIVLIQNPAIGALALWRFVNGYNSTKLLPAPFPLLFITLPVVFQSDLREVLLHTHKSSGLSKLTEKLGTQKNMDQLYAIHYSAEQYKILTLQSLHIAQAAKLVFVETQTGDVVPLLQDAKKMDNADAQEIVDAAEKFGFWCGKLTLHEVSTLLKVRF